jgi:hypothetical protein
MFQRDKVLQLTPRKRILASNHSLDSLISITASFVPSLSSKPFYMIYVYYQKKPVYRIAGTKGAIEVTLSMTSTHAKILCRNYAVPSLWFTSLNQSSPNNMFVYISFEGEQLNQQCIVERRFAAVYGYGMVVCRVR